MVAILTIREIPEPTQSPRWGWNQINAGALGNSLTLLIFRGNAGQQRAAIGAWGCGAGRSGPVK